MAPVSSNNPDQMSRGILEYLYHHLFLPSKLPNTDDSSQKNDTALLGFLLLSLERFLPGRQDVKTVKASIAMLKSLQASKTSQGYLKDTNVLEVFQSLSAQAPVAVLHITEQNAGVLIGRTANSVRFEVFELSPTNEAVTSNRGRLIRRFPATAVEITRADFDTEPFRFVVAKTLAKMSQQTVRETKQTARKSEREQWQEESRETTDPRIVTELFACMLRGCGKEVVSKGICKNTRDEVMWKDSKEPPWRRSSLWLLLRVALQLSMTRLSGDGHNTYKEFMAFLMAQALNAANQLGKTDSNILHTMSSKVSRRLSKLRSPSSGPWLLAIQQIVTETAVTINKRWTFIRDKSAPPLKLEELSSFKSKDNTDHLLKEMDAFLASISRRSTSTRSLGFHPVSRLSALTQSQLPAITECDSAQLSYHLIEIESWVAANLQRWTDHHMAKTDSPVRDLKRLIETYHQKASEYYFGHPEGVSRMVLTIGELWRAVDATSVSELPLLARYEPQIPTVVFQALLLGSEQEMQRLKNLEDYIVERNRVAKEWSFPSIFCSFGKPGSFAVEFFNTSARLQQLKHEIEEDAMDKRQQKRNEFQNRKLEYANLMQKHAAMECDVATKREDGARVSFHPSSCRRCSLETKAKALAVFVHEWPLPEIELEAQATVFEMTAPPTFTWWRDVTIFLINDVLLSEPQSSENPQTFYSLKEYQPLKPWYSATQQSRIQLRSATKPNAVIHRRAMPIWECVESQVCLNSGLLYRYFDGKLNSFSFELAPSERLCGLCTFKLPDRATTLNRFLLRTWKTPNGQTPNEVLASQHECPEWMSLSEFKALASLPYGNNIQWMNILVQLAMPKVDFNRPETALFLLQISLQVGPASSEVTRFAHRRLRDSEFGRQMLEHLTKCLWRVKENWEAYVALWCFTFLAARALPLVSEDLSLAFLDFLTQSRGISHEWVKALLKRAEGTSNDEQRKDFLKAALSIALVCADSFNVHDGYLPRILHDPGQASILVECSIIINENAQLSQVDGGVLQQNLFERWRYTMYRARPILVQQNASGEPFISDAIHRHWHQFKPESPWVLSGGTDCWYQTTMANLKVQLDILTGELLVNGVPLSRLPEGYEDHLDYRRLFKGLSLHVMPSMYPGMAFCTTQSLHGYGIHFGRQGRDILIHLENDRGSFELIPPRVFTGLIPDYFVDDYAHWYNNDTGSVEFCLLRDPFPIESDKLDKWHLEPHAGSWKLHQNNRLLVLSPSSGLAKRIAGILGYLETPLSIHMLYDAVLSCLEIKVPRLQMQFVLKDGESIIRSQQYQDMHIDNDQSVGTLVGFKSKLVLRSDRNPPKRVLIVPEGELEFKRQGGDTVHDHISVSIAHGTCRRVQAYRMDELLGRLVADTKFESKLYLAYLHALTSSCLPDPFIGQQGTEEALEILSSASARAPTALSPISCRILSLIAALAPRRRYHPEGSKMMQNAMWSSHLSLSTQDDRFLKITDDIFQRFSETRFLYPDNEAWPVRPVHTTAELAQRAISRSVGRQEPKFGVGSNDTGNDELYHSRDITWSDRAVRASEIANRAFHQHQCLFQPVAGGLALHLYNLMAVGKLANHGGIPSKRELEYDSMWLQKPGNFISSHWCQLHYAFRGNQHWLHPMELTVWISTIAYSAEYDDQLTQALLLMATSPVVAAAPLPWSDSHDLSKGYTLQFDVLEAAAANHSAKAKQTDAKSQTRLARSERKVGDQLKREYGKDKKRAILIFRDGLGRQWPCQAPKQPNDYHMEAYIDVPRAMRSILSPWKTWWANKNFKEYLEGFVDILKRVSVEALMAQDHVTASANPKTNRRKGPMSATDSFHCSAPDTFPVSVPALEDLVEKLGAEGEESEKLTQVVGFLESRAIHEYERHYLSDMRQSLSRSKDYGDNGFVQGHTNIVLLQQHLARCETRYSLIYNSLSEAIQASSKSGPSSPEDVVNAILFETGYLPKITPTFFLLQLKKSNWSKLSMAWKDAIIEHGLAVTALQRAKRLVRVHKNPVDLLRELENKGHQGWSPHEYPEWLLLECESDIMIRQVQQQIAREMIQPPGNNNAVMQLNMGEGKSSVIVPMASAALGDGSKLVRVIVAKAQAKQMYQMLVSKISGLLDRPVYQLPYCRDVPIDVSRIAAIHQLMIKCQKEGGVLLVQPEHLLSLQLMELELALNKQSLLAEHMMMIRRLFEDSSRDIVDESDENFGVKFELIYTLGQQQEIDHSPTRWIVAQEVLGLVRHFGARVKLGLPDSIDFDDRYKERFPKIRILRPDAADAIIDRAADFICETGMPGFPISHQPPAIRNAVRTYITQWTLSSAEIEEVELSRFWGESTMRSILLLRGLFAGGILAFALARKQWRVHYGLDPAREKKTRLAVPYKAKDCPTPRSEFSHPDIVIVLTCLSYYYGGLDDQALFESLELLLRSDNADLQYQAWVQTAPTLPESCRQIKGINLRDRTYCTSAIFPHLRYSKAAIDYYLCRVVFVKECKEFPHKLSASGWDLGKKKAFPTTGFSGTNDSRYILPLNIKQLDLPEQSHTNALVLKYLLRPENRIVVMKEETKANTFDSQSLLEMMQTMRPKPRVILDVGAQVLDLTNAEMARTWLGQYGSDENTQAAIFFNESDELVVLDRSGKTEALQVSPFADQLERCLVFLDEAHTRGTDLRLPADCQAAVTLGAHITKDRLVQACMRMRKLGKGQSVVFFISREIEQKIGLLRGRTGSSSDEITVSDVLCWAITETCNDLRRAVPLWLTQGLRCARQQPLWNELTACEDVTSRLECAERFMEDEAQSIERRYCPRQADCDISSMIDDVDVRFAAEFRRRCHEFGLTELRNASFSEEQERELSPETEQEPQVAKPLRAKPSAHRIHPGLKDFIVNGLYPKLPFTPAFMTLASTSAAIQFDVSEFSKAILATEDFAKTLDDPLDTGGYSDCFQKPVQWILSTRRDNKILIVSAYEAQQLLPAIEQSQHVTLHLYSPRVNFGYDSLDNLDLYSISETTARQKISRHIISRLNQFAGQLYISSFDDYVLLCDSLGLTWKPINDHIMLEEDGFIPPNLYEGEVVNKSGFSKSPVRFMKILMGKIRQDSEHIESTHVGRILDGARLLESDFGK
ncbi:hypothetical protein CSIM01_12989 [Colletotrichum simmondsii]|uniref:ubiquitinyl hydrolase 1 n=1 Tax=Colletotrichum simmondsii TaxID=703756 RepID=A0A135RMY9_9PEZI|nr:hypothetical protein CSIM01_12989 [Colletotrichum simmondsii]